jgi:hypothetical protein
MHDKTCEQNTKKQIFLHISNLITFSNVYIFFIKKKTFFFKECKK